MKWNRSEFTAISRKLGTYVSLLGFSKLSPNQQDEKDMLPFWAARYRRRYPDITMVVPHFFDWKWPRAENESSQGDLPDELDVRTINREGKAASETVCKEMAFKEVTRKWS